MLGFSLFFILILLTGIPSCQRTSRNNALFLFNFDWRWNSQFIDGLVIAASFVVALPIGVATTLAVALHEIPQEIGDFGVLVYGGFKKIKVLLLNFLSAISAIFGGSLVISFQKK